MPDRDNLIYKALTCATSLNAREKEIAIEAWFLAKKSHDALSSAWAVTKEKVQLAENDDEAKEYWAKFEGVRAQYALIDKIAQQKEQLAQKWRPSKVIYVDDDEEDPAREDAARENGETESSPEAVEISQHTSAEVRADQRRHEYRLPGFDRRFAAASMRRNLGVNRFSPWTSKEARDQAASGRNRRRALVR
ncbi:hypothetical protein K4K54_004433 [Colletotrichum sp. SAR 10_86]|nr:hypothetical protein K4K54_004433 [Colletotrichum sp. SAR 10_86]